MPINDDNLLPYVEGALDEEQSAEMAARLAADSELDVEAKRLRRTVGSLRRAAALPPPSVRPADHWPALQACLVLAPASRRAPVWIWAAFGAALVAAASLAALLLLRLPTHHTPAALPASVHPTLPAVSPPKTAATAKRPLNAHYSPLAAPSTLPYAEANPFVASPKPPVKVRRVRRFRRHRRVFRHSFAVPVKSGVVLGPPVETALPRVPAFSPAVKSPP